jgi:Tol biopolymer transport system component
MRIFLILIFIISFHLSTFSQEIKISKLENVNNLSIGSFFYPQFSPDGSKLYFTSGNYQGLWEGNLKDNTFTQLNNYFGAGMSPVFTQDGLNIIFRKDEYLKHRKYSSIIAFNLISKKETELENQNRYLTKPILTTSGDIVYKKKNIKTTYNHDFSSKSNTPSGKFVFTENSKLVLYDEASRKELNSIGNGNYLWISLSPDHSKILFTKAGEGTYISDLDGNILVELGYANAPVWSPDGNWIAFMDDKDNGYYYISSEIFVVSENGSNKYQITNTDSEIEMYPQWAPDGKKITFHTTNGHIKIVHLEIE